MAVRMFDGETALVSRPVRLHIEGGFYHVILRGNHREAIFDDDADRVRFGELVGEAVNRDAIRVHAFCWMTNHVHLLIEAGAAPIGPAMMRIASRYARAAQRHRTTTGHLFERRYRAVLVDSERYLTELVRYIHLSPVRAGLAPDPVGHPWSGHRAYLGLASWTWLTTSVVLARFGVTADAARLAYRSFVLEGIALPADPRFSRGRDDEPRVLGDDHFLARMEARSLQPRPASIDTLIAAVCGLEGVDPSVLGNEGRRRDLAQLRVLVVHHALERRVATISELARRFRRSPSTLAESLEHYRRRKPEIFKRSLDL